MTTPTPPPPRTRAQIRGEEHAAPFSFPDGSWAVGLTVREAFALAALQGFIAEGALTTHSDDAEAAVKAADALLAALHPEPIHPEGKGDGFRRVCHVCHAAKDEEGQHVHCPACDDTGVLEADITDAGANVWIPCPACDGKGETTTPRGKVTKCKACDGTGDKFPAPEE